MEIERHYTLKDNYDEINMLINIDLYVDNINYIINVERHFWDGYRNYSRVLHILINSDDELKNRILTRCDCHKKQ